MGSSMKPDFKCKITCDFEVLRNSSIFAGADGEMVKLFAYLAGRKKYAAGDYIIHEGREAEAAFYLLSGSAEVSVSHNDREVVLQQLTPPVFFGELALLARFKWFFNVRALEGCETLIITRESFQKVVEKFPARRESLIERIVQLRVQRLIEQTSFMLEKVPDSILNKGGPLL
ncbi:cyclic nucleotide-binding domain-containing protein [Desulfopila inferna]|uniref:cyclic nucleotide-binding domain-containing protein n=1 Tax=Desulfopila inferna TaxID=468528 RepID=UPI0019629694|nr:cyclic nucleotide-binding domain-containing protein [Desulfopila inferna]MBM9605533.1 cyclic nucleotide-binding domain-containing protein [Desulfopila inferna]